MVWIDAAFRWVLCSKEVECAWCFVQKSGEVFTPEDRLDNCRPRAGNLLENFHRLFCYSLVIDCYGVGIPFKFDDRFGSKRSSDTFGSFLDFCFCPVSGGLVEGPYCSIEECFVRYDILLCPAVDCPYCDYERLDGVDHSTRYSLQ